eukprot:GHVS01003522.1.p1 GENE.GHVS01003522.1~~GHVS01003522.1.p1  ORF type:complete len:708 (-),score=87.09 GHVS01003522.1:320-2275(-)
MPSPHLPLLPRAPIQPDSPSCSALYPPPPCTPRSAPVSSSSQRCQRLHEQTEQTPASTLRNVTLPIASKACVQPGRTAPLPLLSSPPPSGALSGPSAADVQAGKKIAFVSGLDELMTQYIVQSPLDVCGNVHNSARAMLNEAVCRKTSAGRIVKTIQKDRLSGCQTGLDEWRSMSTKILQMPPNRAIMNIVEVKESMDQFFLISEKLEGGELFDYLLTEQAIPEETCKYIMRQIGTAASLLHANNLVHRDIKPENIMFRHCRKNAKLDHNVGMCSKHYRKLHELALIDFDTCKLLNAPPEVRGGRRRLVGTYGYLAPEVLKHGHYSVVSDLWSIGVILYILMTGISPLPLEAMVGSREALVVLLRAEKYGIDFNVSPLPDFPLARDLCRRLLCFDVEQRCSSTSEMLAHPWLVQEERIPAAPSPPRDTNGEEDARGDEGETGGNEDSEEDSRAMCGDGATEGDSCCKAAGYSAREKVVGTCEQNYNFEQRQQCGHTEETEEMRSQDIQYQECHVRQRCHQQYDEEVGQDKEQCSEQDRKDQTESLPPTQEESTEDTEEPMCPISQQLELPGCRLGPQLISTKTYRASLCPLVCEETLSAQTDCAATQDSQGSSGPCWRCLVRGIDCGAVGGRSPAGSCGGEDSRVTERRCC